LIAASRRPVVRYHGGKWLLAPWIIEHFPAHRVYVEPFGGGGSVLMRKPLTYAEVYNDLHDEIVGFFRVLRDPKTAEDLRNRLELTPFARAEFDAAYEPSEDPIEIARKLVIRSFFGFGSDAINLEWRTGFRASSKRSGTTPAHDWANYPDCIPAFTARLRGVVIECRGAADVIVAQDSPETLIYADPPYVHAARITGGGKRHTERYSAEMSDDDHRALARVLHDVRGMVVLSGYRSDLYDELYGGWQRVERASFADGASPRTECLWLSPRTQGALSERLLW
jgi:DNA adenine methylase